MKWKCSENINLPSGDQYRIFTRIFTKVTCKCKSRHEQSTILYFNCEVYETPFSLITSSSKNTSKTTTVVSISNLATTINWLILSEKFCMKVFDFCLSWTLASVKSTWFKTFMSESIVRFKRPENQSWILKWKIGSVIKWKCSENNDVWKSKFLCLIYDSSNNVNYVVWCLQKGRSRYCWQNWICYCKKI
jgi:hypothetical protein